MKQDFDKFLEKIGGFGRYQKKQLFFGYVPICLLTCFNVFSMVFYLTAPHNGCNLHQNTMMSKPEDLPFMNFSMEVIPLEFNHEWQMYAPSMCNVYDLSATNWTYPDGGVDPKTTASVPCPVGRWWDTSMWKETVVTKLDLACDKKWVVEFLYAVGSFGELAILPFTSYMQDNWGRKPTMFLLILIYFLTSICQIWVPGPQYQLMIFLYFIRQGVSHVGFSIAWLMAIEITGTDYHSLVMIVMCVVFSISCAISVLAAYLVDSFVTLTIILSVPILGCYLFWPLIDEPARWYLSHKKTEEARKIMTKMLHQNGIQDQSHMEALLEGPGTELENFQMDKNGVKVPAEKADVGKYGVWYILTTPNLFFKSVCAFILTFSVVLVYMGLMINAEFVGYAFKEKEPNVQFIILGIGFLVEIPAVACVLLSNVLGRVWITCGTLILGGIFLAAAPAMGTAAGVWGMITFYIIAKFFVTISFDVVYMFVGELYPTVMRASGVAAAMLGGAIGGIAAPYVVMSGANVQITVFSVLSIISGFFGMWLPETMGAPLVDRAEDDNKLRAGPVAFVRNLTFDYTRKKLQGRATQGY